MTEKTSLALVARRLEGKKEAFRLAPLTDERLLKITFTLVGLLKAFLIFDHVTLNNA